MFRTLVIAALCAGCLADTSMDMYSFSNPVGGGSGESFSTEGEGRITAVKIWEHSNAYIAGIQLRFGYVWSAVVGKKTGTPVEMELHDGEVIVQVSGKYHSNYVYQLFFVTSEGRFLMAGQPTQNSFNMYPKHPRTELKMLSGRVNSAGITALGAHWGMVSMSQETNGSSSNKNLIE